LLGSTVKGAGSKLNSLMRVSFEPLPLYLIDAKLNFVEWEMLKGERGYSPAKGWVRFPLPLQLLSLKHTA
jgi:hypothetical protein